MFHPVSIEELYPKHRTPSGYYHKLLKEFMQSEHICVKCDMPGNTRSESIRTALYAAISRLGLKGSVTVRVIRDDIYLVKPDKV